MKRQILIDGRPWEYTVGRSNCSARDLTTGRGYYISFAKLLGTDWDTIERASWKRYLHITPEHIYKWLSPIVPSPFAKQVVTNTFHHSSPQRPTRRSKT